METMKAMTKRQRKAHNKKLFLEEVLGRCGMEVGNGAGRCADEFALVILPDLIRVTIHTNNATKLEEAQYVLFARGLARDRGSFIGCVFPPSLHKKRYGY